MAIAWVRPICGGLIEYPKFVGLRAPENVVRTTIASFYFGFGFLSAVNRHEVSMFVNARAIIERETTAGLQIVVQIRNKPHEGTKKIELPGGQVNEYESLIDALKR